MRPPVRASIAACLVTGLLVGSTGTPAAPAEVAVPPTPLTVAIDSMSPSGIPARGEVTVTGRVTNRSDETWTDLNVYLLTSSEPFTTAEQLATAQRTDPTTEIGDRLTGAELYQSIGDLAPGSSARYRLSVGREDLDVSGGVGVYWLGVHVLGANVDGRDSVADGRARTYAPLMEPNGPRATLALVMALKAGVRRGPEGRLQNVRRWQELLRPGGRLVRLLRLGATSDAFPLTWVLDPALIDAASAVAAGNPAMSIAPSDGSTGPEPEPEPEPEPGGPTGESSGGSSSGSSSGGATASPEPSDADSPTGSGSDADEQAEPPQEAQWATRWLDLLRRQSARHAVLTVPYGDLDVAATLRRDFDDLLDRAFELGTRTTEGLGVASGPLVAPATGFLPADVLAQVNPRTPVLLADAAVPATPGPVLATERGLRIGLVDGTAGSGGPAPTPPYRALALRQRILGGAAVHALSPDREQPLIVTTPQRWNPGGRWRAGAFLSGLDVPWVTATDLPNVLATPDPTNLAAGADRLPLRYPPGLAEAEVGIANLLATDELVETGEALADLLTDNDTVDGFLARSAMLASSQAARGHRRLAARRARRTTALVRSLMSRVRVEGPSFVTMSSEEGTFAVTLVNDLDEPVTVGVVAETGSDDLSIASPDPVPLPAGARASLRLRATASEIGLHSVTLIPTNSEGRPVGTGTEFNVRSSQVGLVIWVIMGLGAGVLLLTSGMRIVKRIRSRDRDRAAPAGTAPG